MKQNIFKYIAIAATLLVTALNASAQYNFEGGLGTSKKVIGPDAETGEYTIRLETFASGTTTVNKTYKPVDVVLVLDVSGSMDQNGKMGKLKTAVNTFIETIQEDDLYIVERDAQGNVTSKTRRKDKDGNEIALGNRISIVKFALPTYYNSSASDWVTTSSTASITPGNHFPAYEIVDGGWGSDDYFRFRDYNTDYNAAATWQSGTDWWGRPEYSTYRRANDTEVLMGFTATESDTNVQALQTAVTGMISAGSTASDFGLELARLLLTSEANPKANKVVIFFTDGSPTYFSDFDNDVANSAITKAKAIKDAGASIFSIGVFDTTPYGPPQTTVNNASNIWRYMNFVSSNYPNATNITTPGTGGDYTKKFYQDASSSSADLTAIFTAIAQGISSTEATADATSQVRDVVTNSFVLPDNVTAAGVKTYTSEASGSATSGTDTNVAQWGPDVLVTGLTTNIVLVDENGDPVELDNDGNPKNPEDVKNKALIVEGFNYTLADSAGADGSQAHPYGNIVSPRYRNNQWIWAGKKLIIEFKVKADKEATGGETLTNTGNSGVYVINDDGDYERVNTYEQPHTTLSVNIKIRKTGLRCGESATFEILKIRPKGYDPDGATQEAKIANIEYNIIGKPLPGTTDPTLPEPTSEYGPDWSDYYKSMGWDSFKKVILTNKGDVNGAEVVKEIYALDPYWVYMVMEDDWGWAYTMEGDSNQVGDDGTYTTSSVEVNPFRFHNTEKTNAVKHAEAVMINHFQSEEDSDSSVEHYKSSKVESFTSTK